MRFTAQTRPALTSLEDVFYCRGRRRALTLDNCLEGYLDAMSLGRRARACFCCPVGRMNRQSFADVDEEETA